MTRLLLLVACISACSAASAQTLAEAAAAVLQGKSRSVRVELKDAMGDYVRKTTGSTSPVYAEVSSLKDFPQPQCKRLQVRVTAPDAFVDDKSTGKRVPFSFRYEMNLCSDGQPPQNP